jgi:hypothetical protein
VIIQMGQDILSYGKRGIVRVDGFDEERFHT